MEHRGDPLPRLGRKHCYGRTTGFEDLEQDKNSSTLYSIARLRALYYLMVANALLRKNKEPLSQFLTASPSQKGFPQVTQPVTRFGSGAVAGRCQPGPLPRDALCTPFLALRNTCSGSSRHDHPQASFWVFEPCKGHWMTLSKPLILQMRKLRAKEEGGLSEVTW